MSEGGTNRAFGGGRSFTGAGAGSIATASETRAAMVGIDARLPSGCGAQAGLAIAVARLDEELKGLAHRIAETPGTDAGLRDRLAGEVTSVLARSLRPATLRAETLAEALGSAP